ncbi:hypothetical protein [Mesorhizobium sp. USDA 4775]
MIFVPSAGGISHNPREHTLENQLIAGANVLLDTAKELVASPPCLAATPAIIMQPSTDGPHPKFFRWSGLWPSCSYHPMGPAVLTGSQLSWHTACRQFRQQRPVWSGRIKSRTLAACQSSRAWSAPA